MRQGKATIVIQDLWDGINQDSKLFIINGNIYKKLEIADIMELSVHATILKIKPNSSNKIKFTVKSDGVQNPDFYTTFDSTYQVYSSSVNDIVEYTFTSQATQTVYMTGRIGFELDLSCELIDVVQWGDSKFCYFSKLFKNFVKKSISAYDNPDIQYVTTLYQTFYNSHVSIDMNVLDTNNIQSLNQAYKYSISPDLRFQYPTFKNVKILDEAFSYINSAAINWVGLKFEKLNSSLNMFQMSNLNGNIINCQFGSITQVNPNIYNATSTFKNLTLNGSINSLKINSNILESLFELATINEVDIKSFTFINNIISTRRMFYGFSTEHLKIDSNITYANYANSQEMFNYLNILGIFEFKNITFGFNQYCSNMFTSMNYSSATIYNIDFNGAVMDYMFQNQVYNESEFKNIKVSFINTSKCTSFISCFENNDNILIHNPELININMTQAIDISSIYKGCKKFNFKNFYVTASSFPNVVNASSMFENCSNMQANTTSLKMANLKYANNMFRNCSIFDSSLAGLLAVNLEQSDYMLENCALFNSSYISSQNLISAIGMLKNCSSFNQPILFNFKDDNITKTFAKELFKGCKTFNPVLSLDLDLSRCDDGSSLLEDCFNFNQTINIQSEDMKYYDLMFKGTRIDSTHSINMNTTNALSMRGIFSYTTNFGADLNSFNTPNVLDFSYMLYYSSNFTSDLSVIEMDNNLTLVNAFSNSNYNLNKIGGWLVNKVKNYTGCFENSSFNQSLLWMTTAGQTYTNMFRNNVLFNQPLTNFDFTEALTTENMLFGCTVFNQDLSSKRFNKCTKFDFMFYNANAYKNQSMVHWLDTSVKTGISHIGFIRSNNTTNTEPVWK